jgi:hypothetical protein
LSSRVVISGAIGLGCAAAGGELGCELGGGFGAGAATDASDAAVTPGAASREGMTPVNQSAAAAAAMSAAPTSALAMYDAKRAPERRCSDAFELAASCPAAPASPAVALSAAPSTSVAANSMVGGRREDLSSVSLVMPTLLKQMR